MRIGSTEGNYSVEKGKWEAQNIQEGKDETE